jgi:hypothetical protein
MLGSDDGFISVHREARERKRKSPRSGCASEALHQHYYAGESRVYSYTPIISRLSSIVKSRRDISYMRPDMVLPHGAVTAGAEAPRQRRAQRAEGKRLRGVAPVVASMCGQRCEEGLRFSKRPARKGTIWLRHRTSLRREGRGAVTPQLAAPIGADQANALSSWQQCQRPEGA